MVYLISKCLKNSSKQHFYFHPEKNHVTIAKEFEKLMRVYYAWLHPNPFKQMQVEVVLSHVIINNATLADRRIYLQKYFLSKEM